MCMLEPMLDSMPANLNHLHMLVWAPQWEEALSLRALALWLRELMWRKERLFHQDKYLLGLQQDILETLHNKRNITLVNITLRCSNLLTFIMK